MEWTQIAAWVAWAWVGFATLCAMLSFISLFRLQDSETIPQAALTAACALNAILGLMLIQTLGLTV